MIELAVVVAIMAIMTAIIVPRYASYKNTKSLSYAKTQMVNDIRYAQTYTLSTKKMPDASSPSGVSPTGGYGVHFEKGLSTYVIFGDRIHGVDKPNHIYNAGSAENELFETVNLVEGVTIFDLKVNDISVPSGVVDYVSEPPYGKAFINDSNSNTLKIILKNSVGTTEVTITSAGFIS